MTEDSVPIFAQWNYRIACHPLSKDLHLNRLRVVDDIQNRMERGQTLSEFAKSKKARFSVNLLDRKKFVDKPGFNKLLDEIMNEIPGKNNYPGLIYDYGAGAATPSRKEKQNDDYLNAARYHRFHVVSKDASGRQSRYRGFSDQNLYMALTNQSKIVGMDNTKCFTGKTL